MLGERGHDQSQKATKRLGVVGTSADAEPHTHFTHGARSQRGRSFCRWDAHFTTYVHIVLCAHGHQLLHRRRCCALNTASYTPHCLQCITMNLSLVDPFVLAQDCPDVITGRLRESRYPRPPDHGSAVQTAHGTQVAVILHPFALAIAVTCLHPDEYVNGSCLHNLPC